MNLKNISIILAFLSLKVISSPINDVITEGEVTAVEISNAEVSADESVAVNVDVDSVVEDEDSEFSELETPAIPSGPVNNNNSNEKDNEKLPCNNFYECTDWIENNLDTLNLFIQPKLSKEIIQYMRDQYHDGKTIEILQQNFDAINYGIKVDVDGHQMSVNIKGEDNEKTIVVLNALGVISPITFYKSITDRLANDYRVVTVEPFGYGLSDVVEKERTAENVANEIHTCLQHLGITKYYLMGHSIGGIYSLMMDHMFPGEVLGFIGLDNTPSNYDTFPIYSYPEIYKSLTNILYNYHMIELLPEEIKRPLTSIDLELQYQTYSEQELKDIEVINYYKVINPNILNENESSFDIVQATNGLYFQCPILMFIASDTINQTKEINTDWEGLHKNMITDPETSEVIVMDAIHILIHFQHQESIAKKINEWIK